MPLLIVFERILSLRRPRSAYHSVVKGLLGRSYADAGEAKRSMSTLCVSDKHTTWGHVAGDTSDLVAILHWVISPECCVVQEYDSHAQAR